MWLLVGEDSRCDSADAFGVGDRVDLDDGEAHHSDGPGAEPEGFSGGGRGDVGRLRAGPGGQVQLGCYATDISQLHQLPQLVPIAFPAGAATFAQASAALTETEPLGRFAGRRGLGKRDSRPLREAVGELVAAVPFSLKPVHGLTCPGCGPRKRTNRRPLTSSRPRSRATCTPARTGTPRASALPCAGAAPIRSPRIW